MISINGYQHVFIQQVLILGERNANEQGILFQLDEVKSLIKQNILAPKQMSNRKIKKIEWETSTELK